MGFKPICSHCGAVSSLEASLGNVGNDFRCAACGKVFVIEVPSEMPGQIPECEESDAAFEQIADHQEDIDSEWPESADRPQDTEEAAKEPSGSIGRVLFFAGILCWAVGGCQCQQFWEMLDERAFDPSIRMQGNIVLVTLFWGIVGGILLAAGLFLDGAFAKHQQNQGTEDE